MSRILPWDQIATPVVDYNVRLASRNMGAPTYWGKDALGQSLTIIELTGDHSAEFRRDPVVVHGISVDLRAGESPGTQRLVLTLQQQINADLFLSLCEALITALSPVTDSTVAMSVSLAHLRRWKTFLSGKRTGILSAEEVRGLFAELQFLRELYQSRLPEPEAVEAWCGADRVQQDFIFRDNAVEVKSLSGKERNAVRISSEDQLETLSGRLFLEVFRLTDLPDSPEALSLNALVALIEGELTDAQAIESFMTKIAAAGYAPLPDYDHPAFAVSETRTFAVIDGFPRLVRSELPTGIATLSYDLELESIEGFERSREVIFEAIDGTAG
jgi:Putative  PD-(D/E)XK family member, (DUF4420)